MCGKLFPADLPALEWVQFRADGFSKPVSGVIHRRGCSATCGMPLGGIDTGCLDLEDNGTFGYSSIFNSHCPRRGPMNTPFLGISIGYQTWLMSTLPLKGRRNKAIKGILPADDIHYWGHYPIADLQFDTTAPIEVSLRAWSPFIPGDIENSCIPGAVFEVRLRNVDNDRKNGTLAFSFPGPSEVEAGSLPLRRRLVESEGLKGIEVSGDKAGYVLGVLEEANVNFGGDLCVDGLSWVMMGTPEYRPSKEDNEAGGAWALQNRTYLPYAEGSPGASATVDFDLEPGAESTVRFILTWHSPEWRAGGTPDGGGNRFQHMYDAIHPNALESAQLLAREHESLLLRILAWQEVIYGEETLPVWLRDSLVNILHLITEDGMWAQAKPPIPDWCRPEDGLFGMNEDPHSCPQIECIPCSFMGNFPLIYFFPELALSTLRGYKGYQDEEGGIPWIFGGTTCGGQAVDMASPTRGYQVVLNGPCYIDMVDRYWMVTGDDDFLREFYPSVKKNTLFNVGLNRGPDGIISMPDRRVSVTLPKETEWFEACDWAGMVTHVGGVHIASLRMVERMAERVGDHEFAEQCRRWIDQGSESLENKLWNGDYYINYLDPEADKRSDLIMANQLDGEWMTFMHDLPRVFRAERFTTALETIGRTCVAAAEHGMVNFTDPRGIPTSDGEGRPGWSYNPYEFFTPGILMLGMVHMYAGQRELGLELCYRAWENQLKAGQTWDQANIMRGDTGEVTYGNDYYQNMQIWTLPSALQGKGLAASCLPGGLVDRVLQAGIRQE